MKNVYLVGMMGCGKTSVGKILAQQLKMKFVDLDQIIEQRENKKIKDMFAEKGEEYFREKESFYLEEISREENCVVSTGGGVVVTLKNIEIMQNSGDVVWIFRDIDETLAKVNSAARPLMQQGEEKFKALFEERREKYMNASKYIIFNDCDIETCAGRIIKAIK